ncbi:MAG: hypothetical protein JWP89_5008 [Schlesneria sp.]|nr:hypothetical protein [Schlesneria sp.]
MGRILLAFRVFFKVLFNGEVASRVDRALVGLAAPEPTPVQPAPVPKTEERPRPEPKRPTQSEAVTLLATLQREARLVDFLKEDLSGYTDDQVGAAVRAIHQDAAKVLDRLFSIRAVVSDEEGAAVEVPAGFDAARYRFTGKVAGEAPFRGTLRHHGWEAGRCELPQFTGSDSGAKTIAPAEVELG